MDTSKEYIEMCGKAEEIQNLRPQKEYGRVSKYGDYFYSRVLKEVINNNPSSAAIWLPRQDQLQEMLVESFAIDGIKHFWIEIEAPEISWEQLWFRYVMYEKFGKVWDGKKWTL